MDATQRTVIMQRWRVIQSTLISELKTDLGPLTPKLERLIPLLEWVRIEEFVVTHRCGVGRPAHERPACKQVSPAPRTRHEAVKEAKPSPIARQHQQTLEQMCVEIPQSCDRGTKCNAQGYKTSWNGYKLHLDTADCGVPISALLSSGRLLRSARRSKVGLNDGQGMGWLG